MDINEFITFLIDNGLITWNITSDDDEGFNNRFRIQKYTLIATHLNLLDKEYYYDIYLYGPYSSELADEYYAYRYRPVDYSNMPKDRLDRFISVVKDKDNDWLEIASTILHINEVHKDKEILTFLAIEAKSYKYSAERIMEVIDELKELNLLNLN